MDDVADFAAFAATLELPDGRPYVLEPWQRDLLAWIMSDDPPLAPAELELSHRRSGRRQATILSLAAGAITGHRLALCTPDAATRRQLVDAALEHVDRYGEAFRVDVTPARVELERIRTEPQRAAQM